MKPIHIIIFILFLFSATFSSYAQDIIEKRDKSKIEAKIIEVHDDEIHYKKYTNLEGPIYIIETSKISTITYQNGDIENYSSIDKEKNDNSSTNQSWAKKTEQTSEEIEIYNGKFYYHNRRIGVRKMKDLIFTQGNPEAIRMWNSYKTTQAVGYAIGFAAIPLGFITFVGLSSIQYEWQIYLGGGGFIATNLALIANHFSRYMYKNKRFKAVELYNETLKQGQHNEEDYY